MVFSPFLRMAIDFRSIGFTWGVLALFLTPFVLKPLDLSVHKSILSIRNVILTIFLAFVPISTLLILLNYLDYIPTARGLAAVGPFLFVVSSSTFVKLLTNWKHPSRPLQFVVRFEGVVYLAVLTMSLIGIEFIDGQAFNIGFLVGSWATT